MAGYELTEHDIDAMLRYLKAFHPEQATSEMAVAMLEELHANVHELAHSNPEQLESIFNQLDHN